MGEKVEEVKNQTKVLRVYFNNHYGGDAVINALQFKEMIGIKLSENEGNTLSVLRTICPTDNQPYRSSEMY